MVDGVLQVKDAVLQRVADVVLGVAGGRDLFTHGSFHQLLVLRREQWNNRRSSEPRLWPLAKLKRPVVRRLHLDEDLPAELVGRRKLVCAVVHRLGEQQVSEHLLKVSGHVPLLDHTAVVLEGQDDGIPDGKRRRRSGLAVKMIPPGELGVWIGLTRMWRRRVLWWCAARPGIWSWWLTCGRGRWLGGRRVHPSSPLRSKNTESNMKHKVQTKLESWID